MKYTNQPELIKEKPIFSYQINRHSFIKLIAILTAVMINTFLAYSHGWSEISESGDADLSFYGVTALISFCILLCYWGWAFFEFEYPFEKKHFKEFVVPNFNPQYLKFNAYNRAYERCIKEIQSEQYNVIEWEKIFHDLNIQAERYIEGNKELERKVFDPRDDYVEDFKRFNDMYFKGHEL